MKLFQRKLLCSFKFYDQPCLYIAVYKYGYKINFVFHVVQNYSFISFFEILLFKINFLWLYLSVYKNG